MFIDADREAVEVVQGTIREFNLQLQVVKNATGEIIDTLDSLKKRQALAAAIAVFQLMLFLGYLFTLAILYAVKKCKQHRAALIERLGALDGHTHLFSALCLASAFSLYFF